MKPTIALTNDGSSTLFIAELNEHYHSTHGAIQEANHVFIEHGFKHIQLPDFTIFELGFGTGLNAVLTLNAAETREKNIKYISIEAFPVEMELVNQLNYDRLDEIDKFHFESLHNAPWGKVVQISPHFTLQKIEAKIQDFDEPKSEIDLIYFDAFGHRAQSELWELPILQKMYNLLKPNGILVTYAARGQFKRDLKQLGFLVESLPGPPGKREMTRATKIS